MITKIIPIYIVIIIIIYSLLSKFYFYSTDKDKEIKVFAIYSIFWIITIPLTLIIAIFTFIYDTINKE